MADIPLATLKLMQMGSIRHSLGKKAMWDLASVRKISIGDAVIVPIKYGEKVFSKNLDNQKEIDLEKSSYLMVYKDKKQKMHAEWVTMIPVGRSSNGKFAGIIEVEEWDGKSKKAFAIGVDGSTRNVYLSSSNNLRKISFAYSSDCFTVEYYGWVGVEGHMYQQIIGSETYCFGSSGPGQGSYDSSAPQDNSGGNNNSDNPAPGDYPSVVDCAGVLGGSAEIDPSCNTCIGGATGLTACPVKRTVTDSTTTPCIKSAVTLGVQANTTIGNMLNKTFGTSNEYGGLDIEFKQGNTGTDDGWCRKNGNISWVITINQNLPNTSSSELILATVYHEILHAYLEASYPKDATGMFLIPHDEHQDMAENYLTLMIGALKINYPNISDKDAWGLAWGGLHETRFYNDNTKLTANQRLEIGEINRKHKNKSNPLDRSGTYCN